MMMDSEHGLCKESITNDESVAIRVHTGDHPLVLHWHPLHHLDVLPLHLAPTWPAHLPPDVPQQHHLISGAGHHQLSSWHHLDIDFYWKVTVPKHMELP